MTSEIPQNSIICIHPVLEERGKVKGTDDSYHVSLKDCLACSGCAITEDDINLLAHQDPTKLLETVHEHPNFASLISTAALANLAASRNWSIAKAFYAISTFLSSIGSTLIVHDGFWQNVWRALLINFYKSNQTTLPKPFIISRCAGAIMFFERKTEFANHLAPIKPFPQIFAIYQKHCIENSESRFVLNIAPCYDRKLETGRFENDVDIALTIGEINDLIPDDFEYNEAEINLPSFPPDNDALYMIKQLSNSNPSEQVGIKESGNTIEYSLGNLCGAYICGEAALRRLCANISRNRCKYDIVEADLCPNACMAGGGLIRGDTPSTRKKLVSDTISIHKGFSSDEMNDVDHVMEVVSQLQQQNISAQYVSEEKKKDDFTF